MAYHVCDFTAFTHIENAQLLYTLEIGLTPVVLLKFSANILASDTMLPLSSDHNNYWFLFCDGVCLLRTCAGGTINATSHVLVFYDFVFVYIKRIA